MTVADFEVEEYFIGAKVGSQSMIGPGRERPTKWGNYFWLANSPIRVVNFWAENLEELVRNGTLADQRVKVRVYDEAWALIVDDRIDPEWFHNKLCFTGARYPGLPIIRDMYDVVGDPSGEIEQYESPETYWPKHNGEYRNGAVIIHHGRSA
jgi:hypothetical protein